MAGSFDPYYTWLGIPPEEQPPDHYRLLGLRQFEDNREVISHASDQRMAHIKSFQNGQHSRDSQAVLNELAKASGCLLNPRRKAMYDQHLRSSERSQQQEQALAPPDPAAAIPTIQVEVTPAARGRKTPPPRPRAAETSQPKRRVWPIASGVAVPLVLGLAWWALFGRHASDEPVNSPTPVAAADLAVNQPSPAKQPSGNDAPVSDLTGKSTAAPKDNRVPEASAKTSEPDKPGSSKTPASVNGAAEASAVPEPTSKIAPPVEPSLPDVVAGKPKALHFRGSDRVEVENSQGLIDLRKPFTVEMWVRFAAGDLPHWLCGDLVIGPNHLDVANGQIAGWQLFVQQTLNGRRRVAVSTQEGYASDVPVVNDAWHHIAVCNDTKQTTIFVDGRRSATGATDRLLTSFIPSPLPLHIGSHDRLHNNQPPGLTGDMRGFRVSSSCRYTTSFPPDAELDRESDTEILFDFENSNEEQLIDLSGHGRNGRIQGARWIGLESLPRPGMPASLAATSSTPPPSTPPSTMPPSTMPPSKPAASAAPARSPVPEEVELVKAREQLQTIFGEELAKAKEPRQLLELSDKLAALAAESSDSAASRYAMLEEAHRLAAQSGDLPKTLLLVADLGKRFDVDGPKLQAAAVARVAEVVRSAVDRRRLAESALEVVDQLAHAGRFDLAAEVVQTVIAQASRAKEVELGKTAREVRDEINQAKRALVDAQAARDALKTDSKNPELNLQWGRFVCFRQRNWEEGLPFLAQGGNADLAAAAKLDLEQPADGEKQAELGRAWSAAAELVEVAEKPAVLMRSAVWLRKSELQLKGLAKADVEKRIQEIDAALPVRYRSGRLTSGSAGPMLQPPPEFIGLLGRMKNNSVDTEILWRYDPTLRVTNQKVTDVLTQAGIVRGALAVEFMGFLYLPESMTVNIAHSGGSPKGSLTLYVDNKQIGSVGGSRATSDVYKTDLRAGEHAVRWVLSGEDLGNISLAFTNAATGQPLVVYHTPQLLGVFRDGARTRLIVNVVKNP